MMIQINAQFNLNENDLQFAFLGFNKKSGRSRSGSKTIFILKKRILQKIEGGPYHHQRHFLILVQRVSVQHQM